MNKSSISFFKLGALASAMMLAACSAPVTEEETNNELTLSGVVHDGPVAHATVTAYLGDTPIAVALADENGAYEIDLGEQADNKLVRIVATKMGGLELVTMPGDTDTLLKSADANGNVTEDKVPDLAVTNISTAKVAMMKAMNGNTDVASAASLKTLQAKIEEVEELKSKVLELASMIKAVIDGGAELPAGVEDTLDLIDDLTYDPNADVKLSYASGMDTFKTENQDTIDTMEKEMIEDSALSDQLGDIAEAVFTAAELNDRTFYIDMIGVKVTFNSNGTHSVEEVDRYHDELGNEVVDHTTIVGNWSITADGKLRIVETRDGVTETTLISRVYGGSTDGTVMRLKVPDVAPDGTQMEMVVTARQENTFTAATDVVGTWAMPAPPQDILDQQNDGSQGGMDGPMMEPPKPMIITFNGSLAGTPDTCEALANKCDGTIMEMRLEHVQDDPACDPDLATCTMHKEDVFSEKPFEWYRSGNKIVMMNTHDDMGTTYYSKAEIIRLYADHPSMTPLHVSDYVENTTDMTTALAAVDKRDMFTPHLRQAMTVAGTGWDHANFAGAKVFVEPNNHFLIQFDGSAGANAGAASVIRNEVTWATDGTVTEAVLEENFTYTETDTVRTVSDTLNKRDTTLYVLKGSNAGRLVVAGIDYDTTTTPTPIGLFYGELLGANVALTAADFDNKVFLVDSGKDEERRTELAMFTGSSGTGTVTFHGVSMQEEVGCTPSPEYDCMREMYETNAATPDSYSISPEGVLTMSDPAAEGSVVYGMGTNATAGTVRFLSQDFTSSTVTSFNTVKVRESVAISAADVPGKYMTEDGMTIVFNADNSGSFQGGPDMGTFTWAVTSGKLTLTSTETHTPDAGGASESVTVTREIYLFNNATDPVWLIGGVETKGFAGGNEGWAFSDNLVRQ